MRSKTLNLDALRACLELDKLDLAEKLISTKKINMFDKKQIIEIDNYICLLKKISSKKFYEKNLIKFVKIIKI